MNHVKDHAPNYIPFFGSDYIYFQLNASMQERRIIRQLTAGYWHLSTTSLMCRKLKTPLYLEKHRHLDSQ